MPPCRAEQEPVGAQPRVHDRAEERGTDRLSLPPFVVSAGRSLGRYAHLFLDRGDQALFVLTNEIGQATLAVGFAIFTIGAFIGGIFDLILDLPRSIAITTESGLTVVGFAVIIFSLFAEP